MSHMKSVMVERERGDEPPPFDPDIEDDGFKTIDMHACLVCFGTGEVMSHLDGIVYTCPECAPQP